ncbi:hypothetical protein [Armatimonas sp.]|uniref:hypothetical protein n=1 Tax=Armatimonas sp. TaxID=1872638 RepID=UPI00374CB80A
MLFLFLKNIGIQDYKSMNKVLNIDSNIDYIASLVVGHLIPELYEDEVYLWEIVSVLRYLSTQNSEIESNINLVEHDAEFVKKVMIAAVGQILILPGIETFLTGWPLEGDWEPRRLTISVSDIMETIRLQLDQLGREPVALEIAFFRGVES